MGPFDIATMIVALLFMFAAAGAKVLTGQLLRRTQLTISQVNQQRMKAMSELRTAQSHRRFAEQNLVLLTRKKARLEKKIRRLRKELASMRKGSAPR